MQVNAGVNKIRVLVIDDSALARNVLSELIPAEGDIEVIGSAPDPYVARDKIKRLNPDVLTLDVEMPRMDGITFLSNLMRLRPMPVVMVSALTEAGAKQTLRALTLGAADFVTKADMALGHNLSSFGQELRAKIRAAARANLRAHVSRATAQPDRQPALPEQTRFGCIAIGASAGGTEAIRTVVRDLPENAPALLICQHMPALFTTSFATHLNECSRLSITEARDGEPLKRGHGYLAPGDQHLRVVRRGADTICRLDAGAPVNRHRPAVDVMFESVAEHLGDTAIGVLLTGMGKDGARGLLQMRQAGAPTLVQDEATSLVWGMPGEAVRIAAADRQVPLGRVAGAIAALLLAPG